MIIKLQVIKSGNTKPSNYCYEEDVWWDEVPYDTAFDASHVIDIKKEPPHKTRIYVDIVRHYIDDYFIVNINYDHTIDILNGGKETWQNKNYTFTEVERVYSTRIDCSIEPEGVRQAA